MSALEITYNSFINRIFSVNRRDILFYLSKRVLIAFSVFVLLSFLIVSAESIFLFNSIVRKVLLFGFLASLIATIVMILIAAYAAYLKLSQASSIKNYARKIGNGFPEIRDTLLNAIQLYDVSKTKKGYFSNELALANFEMVDEHIKGYNFTSVISFALIKKLFSGFISSLVFFTALFLIFPNVFQASAYRLINYNYNFIENTLGVAFVIQPGNIEIAKGENVNILAKLSFNNAGYSADNINFYTKTIANDGSVLNSNSDKINPDNKNEFHASLGGILSNTIYWFEYKGIKSDENKITVTGRPVIKNAKITIYPPAYTKLPTHVIDGTELSAIFGSKIYVEIEASEDINKASVLFGDGTPYTLDINGKNVIGSFTASKNGTFKFNLIKNFGDKELTNPNPSDYNIHVIPDEYPSISIVEPGQQLNLQNEKDILVISRITDDFGFTKMRLGYKLTKSNFGMTDNDYHYIDIPIKNTDATGLEVPYAWNLRPLNLGTSDEVEYFVEVFDNDGISGPKSSKSEIRKLVMPSLESLLKTEKNGEELENALKSAFEQAMDLKENIDELKEKVEKNPEELGLNDPQKRQELQNKIDNIQNQFNSTQQKMNELMNDVQNNSQISKETLEKYMELQKMFQQIDSKELREMLKKLQDAMKNMSPEQMKEAMKNFKFDEESFKQAMEKTMELLKKILNEQKFGELTQKLDEITKKQDELKENTDKTDESDKNKMNELSKSQEELKKQYEDFMKEMEKLSENMKQPKQNETGQDLEKLKNEMKKKSLEQKMNQSSKDLQNSDKDKSMDQQEDISQNLNEFNQKMQDILNQMLENENNKLQAKMQELLNQLQEESDKQGKLQEQSKDLNENSPGDEFKENAKDQNELSQQLSKSIDQLMGLSKEVPNMAPMMGKDLGDAYNKMQDAEQKLEGKEGKSANKSQGDAKSSLDKAISKLQSMCKKGNMPGKGSSLQMLLQALQQMIARQQALNQQMSELGQKGNNGKLSQEEMAQMQKLQAEQQSIQKGLQQLNKEYKEQQEREGTKLLGNLDEIQKDMEEVIKDLQNQNITPETRKRQEKILSRMLDFQLSQREKDFEKKRESKPGKNFDRVSPPEIVISRPNIIDGINQDALDLQKESYSEDYETLIQKYMEKMKSLGK
ncbi:MAG: DUF4175 family protein [Ignavibacteria bacterium]